MKKVYRIYELISSRLESENVSEEYGYGSKTLQTHLMREIDDTKMGWKISSDLNNGFDSLEAAEGFMKNNISGYETWTIITEYIKE